MRFLDIDADAVNSLRTGATKVEIEVRNPDIEKILEQIGEREACEFFDLIPRRDASEYCVICDHLDGK